METIKYFCDVCKKELYNNQRTNIQVIFTTEQTEGRSSNPYLCEEKIHLCAICKECVLKGNYIFAHGAQGYNTYYFEEK